MDTFMVLFRVIHILAGVYWVGAGIFMALFFEPTVFRLGEEGSRFMRGLYTTQFGPSMALASVLTFVSGLLLYYRVSDGFNADWMRSSGGVVLSIGAVAGILAFGHGSAAIGPSSRKYGALVAEFGEKSPTEEQKQMLRELEQKIGLHARIGMVMSVISVLGMASARYM